MKSLGRNSWDDLGDDYIIDGTDIYDTERWILLLMVTQWRKSYLIHAILTPYLNSSNASHVGWVSYYMPHIAISLIFDKMVQHLKKSSPLWCHIYIYNTIWETQKQIFR